MAPATALQNGAIAGAALDVTDPEPLPDGPPLRSPQNCLITPHTANPCRPRSRCSPAGSVTTCRGAAPGHCTGSWTRTPLLTADNPFE